jgi:hypothetical protein
MHVILAIWEAEVRRTVVQGQLGQIVHKTYHQNNQSKMDWICGSGCFGSTKLRVQTPIPPKEKKKADWELGMVAHTAIPALGRKAEAERTQIQSQYV